MPESDITEEAELQHCLVFSLLAQGQRSEFATQLVRRLFAGQTPSETPFAHLARLEAAGELDGMLVGNRQRQRWRIGAALRELITSGLDLATCTASDLEIIPGIGRVTAANFLSETRPGSPPAARQKARRKGSAGEEPPRLGRPPRKPKVVIKQHIERAIAWLEEHPGAHTRKALSQGAKIPFGSIVVVISDKRLQVLDTLDGRLYRRSSLVTLATTSGLSAEMPRHLDRERLAIKRLLRRTAGPLTPLAIAKALALPYATVRTLLESPQFFYDPPLGYWLPAKASTEGEKS